MKVKLIDKSLDLAKSLLSKILGPPIEELGLLLGDNVKYLRYKNQIRILEKAEKYISKKSLSTKQIPIKILVPLLDKASLEEDEYLQEKWANMLVNMVTSEKNYQSQIFPYILSQLSKDEYSEMLVLYDKELKLYKDLSDFQETYGGRSDWQLSY